MRRGPDIIDIILIAGLVAVVCAGILFWRP